MCQNMNFPHNTHYFHCEKKKYNKTVLHFSPSYAPGKEGTIESAPRVYILIKTEAIFNKAVKDFYKPRYKFIKFKIKDRCRCMTKLA